MTKSERRAAEALAHKAEREEAARKNREAMPITSSNVAFLRGLFGDGIKVLWAIEGARTAGKVPYEQARG